MIPINQQNLKRALTPICFVTLMMFGNALAQTTPVPCSTEPYQQFDFWQGEWKVTSPNGNHVGDNTLTKIQGGCVLQENWRAAGSPFTGTSFNFYDASTEKWQQIWLDNQGGNLHMSGARVGNQMILKTAAAKNSEGKESYNKITWTKNEDGSVRQEWLAITEGQEDRVVLMAFTNQLNQPKELAPLKYTY